MFVDICPMAVRQHETDYRITCHLGVSVEFAGVKVQ